MPNVRSNTYPSGKPIPSELPPSYQPTFYSDAPRGQSCQTCLAFRNSDQMCTKWNAPVIRFYWCAAWTAQPAVLTAKNSAKETNVLKRVVTNTVEEHFDTAVLVPVEQAENEEDVVKFNVPFLILLLEWAREIAKEDADLHRIIERLVDISEYGNVLTVADYDAVVAPPEDKSPRFPQ